jgi:hypothetical protein
MHCSPTYPASGVCTLRLLCWHSPDTAALAPAADAPAVASPAGFVDAGPANLVALTEGIHSKEALELVREHMLGVMGAAASAKFSTELIKMSKFQMAQVGRGAAGRCVLGDLHCVLCWGDCLMQSSSILPGVALTCLVCYMCLLLH